MEMCIRIRIFALSLVAKDRMEPDVNNNNNNFPSTSEEWSFLNHVLRSDTVIVSIMRRYNVNIREG